MNPTNSERQLIELIRELPEGNEFHLTIKRGNGAWDLELSILPHIPYPSRGVGGTFDMAWDNTTPVGR